MNINSSCFFKAIILIIAVFMSTARADQLDPSNSWVFCPKFEETEEQDRSEIQERINQNIEQLKAQGKIPPAQRSNVRLSWVLKPVEGFKDYGYYAITNYVDHDPAYGSLRDYNCGAITYDYQGYNHTGTDFYIWPFPWKKMAENTVEVIAGADGIIVEKQDGNFDKNCVFDASALWNAVYVRHSDGSVAWYGHLKKNSLTSKGIGDSVTTGEYLGIVGSSGRSYAPHLHLEIRDADNNMIDPFQGDCNPTTTTSWWASQKPYIDSGINKITTGDNPTETPECPNPEISNEKDIFKPGDTIYFTVYYRHESQAIEGNYAIYKPDGSVYNKWTHQSEEYYAASYRYWAFPMPSNIPEGRWRFTVEYNGQNYETVFNVSKNSATVSAPENVSASDGEFTDKVRITWSESQGADYYRVYRSTTNCESCATPVSNWQTFTNYDDTSVTAGTTYYYSVKAATSSTGADMSGFSLSDSGYASKSSQKISYLAVAFENDLYIYDGKTWERLGGSPDNMTSWNNRLILNYAGYGLYEYDGTSLKWLSASPENMTAWKDRLVLDYGIYGLYLYDGSSIWTWIAPDPENIAAWGDYLAVSFSYYGLYKYDYKPLNEYKPNSWTWIAGMPEQMISWKDYLAADFGSYGIYIYNGSSWQWIGGNPENMTTWKDYLAADFGEYGLYIYNGSSWQWIAGNPEHMTAWKDYLAADFGGYGVYLYDGNLWTWIAGISEHMVSVEFGR